MIDPDAIADVHKGKIKKRLEYTVYPDKEIVEIEGIRYHYDFFRYLGKMLAINVPFKIVRRRDKTLTIRRIVK